MAYVLKTGLKGNFTDRQRTHGKQISCALQPFCFDVAGRSVIKQALKGAVKSRYAQIAQAGQIFNGYTGKYMIVDDLFYADFTGSEQVRE